jgi:hypothetical protein
MWNGSTLYFALFGTSIVFCSFFYRNLNSNIKKIVLKCLFTWKKMFWKIVFTAQKITNIGTLSVFSLIFYLNHDQSEERKILYMVCHWIWNINCLLIGKKWGKLTFGKVQGTVVNVIFSPNVEINANFLSLIRTVSLVFSLHRIYHTCIWIHRILRLLKLYFQVGRNKRRIRRISNR